MSPPKKTQKSRQKPSKPKPAASSARSPEVLPRESRAGDDEDSDASKEDGEDEPGPSAQDIEDAEITDEEIYSVDRQREQYPISEGSLPSPVDAQGDIDPVGALREIPGTSGRGALSVNDPLRRYLEELRRYPLLDPQQEVELVTSLQRDGDLQAARRLVQANLRLVVKIAFEYRNMYSNVLDLIQEGNVGLMKAVSKFDPTKGARLGYYASWWIRSYILKYLLDNFRLVKIGTTQAQKKLFYHLMREKERLEAQGLLAGPKLLAEKLNVRERDVVEMEQRLSGRGAEMSIDTPIDRGGENSATHADFLADGNEAVDETLARTELLQLLESRLPQFEKTLNEKERRLLQERLLAEEPKTLQEVADLYGLTRERARQIETKVVQKLRDFLKDDFA